MNGLETLKQSDRKRWKLYGTYSPSHEVFLRNWFLATLKDDFETFFERVEQKCNTAEFMGPGWVDAVSEKILFLSKVISESSVGDRFIFSDVDIQWFRPVSGVLDSIVSSRGDIDIFFQEDAFGEFCSGFFVCMANERTDIFWKEVLRYMRANRVGDQKAVKTLLGGDFKHLRVDLLPRRFWGPGHDQKNFDLWVPGKHLNPPADIVFHHANWTSGISNKLDQLKYIHSKVYGAT